MSVEKTNSGQSGIGRRKLLKTMIAMTLTPAFSERVTASTPDLVEKLSPPFESVTRAFTEILRQGKGVFIGETHESQNPAVVFLSSHLDYARSLGVVFIGLEAFDAEDQDLLDAYRESPNTENRARLLAVCKWNSDEEWIRCVDGIHKAGLHVVGIDTRERRDISAKVTRTEVNVRWARAIRAAEKKIPKGGKYIVYGGCHHSRLHGDNPDYVGVNQLLGIHSIIPGNPNLFPGPYYSLKGGYEVVAKEEEMGLLEYSAVQATSFGEWGRNIVTRLEGVSPQDPERLEKWRHLVKIVEKIEKNSAYSNDIRDAARLAQELSPSADSIGEAEGIRQLLIFLETL